MNMEALKNSCGKFCRHLWGHEGSARLRSLHLCLLCVCLSMCVCVCVNTVYMCSRWHACEFDFIWKRLGLCAENAVFIL